MRGQDSWSWSGFLIILAAAALLVSFKGSGDSQSVSLAADDAQPISVPVSELAIIDGDELRWAGHKNIRLLQISAPAPDSCDGRRAQVRLAELVGTEGELVLMPDGRLRTFRGDEIHIYLDRQTDDGPRDLGLRLVREGLARPDFGDDEQGTRAEEIIAARDAARREGKGIWGDCS